MYCLSAVCLTLILSFSLSLYILSFSSAKYKFNGYVRSRKCTSLFFSFIHWFVQPACFGSLLLIPPPPTSITAQKLPCSALSVDCRDWWEGGLRWQFFGVGFWSDASTWKHVHEKGQVLNGGIHMKSRCCIKSSVSLRGMIEELDMLFCRLACGNVCVLWHHEQQMALKLQENDNAVVHSGMCFRRWTCHQLMLLFFIIIIERFLFASECVIIYLLCLYTSVILVPLRHLCTYY